MPDDGSGESASATVDHKGVISLHEIHERALACLLSGSNFLCSVVKSFSMYFPRLDPKEGGACSRIDLSKSTVHVVMLTKSDGAHTQRHRRVNLQ